MSRLWEALTPASGSAGPWTHLAPPAQEQDGLSIPGDIPGDIPWPPHEATACPLMRQDIPMENTHAVLEVLGNTEPENANEVSEVWGNTEPENVTPLSKAPIENEIVNGPEESIWNESEDGSAYVEIGPENEFLVSEGVSVPPFRAHFNLMAEGNNRIDMDPSPILSETFSAPLSIPIPNKTEVRANPSVDPNQLGSIAVPVIRGILERLTHYSMGGQPPWLFLSPGTDHNGLTPKGLKAVMEKVIDSIARQHGPVACLEMDEPMDGGLHAPGPGWQDLLWGRVELDNILVAGRNPLVTRIPRGDDYHPEGTWFATRSIHGVATEIRKRFGLVVVASLSSKPDAIARFWLAQCQGWTWVTSVGSWETTPLEAEARLHQKGQPPWIGCVLVDGVAAAA